MPLTLSGVASISAKHCGYNDIHYPICPDPYHEQSLVGNIFLKKSSHSVGEAVFSVSG